MSDTLKNLTKELVKIQKALKAPKSQYNQFGKYHYRNCEDILEAVKHLLPDNYSVLLTDEVKFIGARYYVSAKAIFTDGTSQIASEAYAREEDSRKGFGADQLTGAASSYARKYALNGLFLIDDTKDADSNSPENNKSENDKKQEKKPDYIQLGRQVYSKINKAKSGDEIKKILAENVEVLDNLKELDPSAFDKINDFAALKTNELKNKPVEIA